MNSQGGDYDQNKSYFLGHSDQELARLNEQARVVGPITQRFFREGTRFTALLKRHPLPAPRIVHRYIFASETLP